MYRWKAWILKIFSSIIVLNMIYVLYLYALVCPWAISIIDKNFTRQVYPKFITLKYITHLEIVLCLGRFYTFFFKKQGCGVCAIAT